MADFGQLMAKAAARRLADAGEAILGERQSGDAARRHRFRLLRRVGQGRDFHRRRQRRKTIRRPHPFPDRAGGEVLFGMDLRYAGDSGFLASAKGDTVVHRVRRDSMVDLSTAEVYVASEVVRLIDGGRPVSRAD